MVFTWRKRPGWNIFVCQIVSCPRHAWWGWEECGGNSGKRVLPREWWTVFTEAWLLTRVCVCVCVRICAAKFAHIVEFLRRISRIIFRANRGGPRCLRCRCKFIISFSSLPPRDLIYEKCTREKQGEDCSREGGKDDRLMIKNITLERRHASKDRRYWKIKMEIVRVMRGWKKPSFVAFDYIIFIELEKNLFFARRIKNRSHNLYVIKEFFQKQKNAWLYINISHLLRY